MYLNRVILIGRLTRQPELRFTPGGTAVANFTLAVDRPFTNSQGERETDFIRIVVWGKQAETCANYLEKGRLVAVEGRLQVRSYQTPDGESRRVTEVVGENVRFLDRAREPISSPQPEPDLGFLPDDIDSDSFDPEEEPPF